MRGRVKWGAQCQPLPQTPEKTALAAGFLLGILMDWVTVRACFVPNTLKGCELPGNRAPKKQQEWLNARQKAGKGWENGVKATGRTIPVGSPSARRHYLTLHLDGSKSSLGKVPTHALKSLCSSQSQAPPGSSQGELPPSLPRWEGLSPLSSALHE